MLLQERNEIERLKLQEMTNLEKQKLENAAKQLDNDAKRLDNEATSLANAKARDEGMNKAMDAFRDVLKLLKTKI